MTYPDYALKVLTQPNVLVTTSIDLPKKFTTQFKLRRPFFLIVLYTQIRTDTLKI